MPTMKRHTVNMFAATNEDLPLFCGMTVDVEVAEFKPVEVVAEETLSMPMFPDIMPTMAERAGAAGYNNDIIATLAICETSGLDGVRRIEEWIDDDHRLGRMSQVTENYKRGLMLYAAELGIEVDENPNVTFDGWYDLYEAMWQRMSPAEQDLYRHTHKESN
jgi:hypothetical protein